MYTEVVFYKVVVSYSSWFLIYFIGIPYPKATIQLAFSGLGLRLVFHI